MIINFNDPLYPDARKNSGDDHLGKIGGTVMSNVKDYNHPYFTSEPMVNMINMARNFANSANEKELSGEVKDKVFEDINNGAAKTRFPLDLLIFALDWEKDMTKRGDAGDAEGLARKLLGYVPALRSTFSRDPLNAEVWMAHVLSGAGKVKEIYDLHIKKPDEIAKPPGSKKDDILIWKKRGENKQRRTNRELYDFFYRRVPVGKLQFKENLGSNSYSGGFDGGGIGGIGSLGGGL